MKSSTICEEWINSLPPTQGYLKNEQSIGREFLSEQGMPSKKDEAWRLSNFNRLNNFLTLPTIIDSEDIKSKFKSIFRMGCVLSRNKFRWYSLSGGWNSTIDRPLWSG